VDQKASIILAFSVALGTLAGREVFGASGGLHDAAGAQLWLVRVMGAAFAISGLLAVSVVLPRLRRRAVRREAAEGLIFFGHLHHRTSAEIERQLRQLQGDEIIHQLARQLHATSKIAWRKHVHLQLAMLALFMACLIFSVARFAF
jgi:hypothetical protein